MAFWTWSAPTSTSRATVLCSAGVVVTFTVGGSAASTWTVEYRGAAPPRPAGAGAPGASGPRRWRRCRGRPRQRRDDGERCIYHDGPVHVRVEPAVVGERARVEERVLVPPAH